MTAVQKQLYLVVVFSGVVLSLGIYTQWPVISGWFKNTKDYNTAQRQLPRPDRSNRQSKDNKKIYQWVDESGSTSFADRKPSPGEQQKNQLQASGEPAEEIKQTIVYRWTNSRGQIQFSDVKPKNVESVKIETYRRDQNVLPGAEEKKEPVGLDEKAQIEQQINQVKEKMSPANIQSHIPQLMKDTEILKKNLEQRNDFLKKEFGDGS